MTEHPIPVVALSDVFDPEAFRALAMQIAMGSIPAEEQTDDSGREA